MVNKLSNKKVIFHGKAEKFKCFFRLRRSLYHILSILFRLTPSPEPRTLIPYLNLIVSFSYSIKLHQCIFELSLKCLNDLLT